MTATILSERIDTGGRNARQVSVARPITSSSVRATIRARKMRNEYFPGVSFTDPSWDMLLALFAAALDLRQVSLARLCAMSGVPTATALRRLDALIGAGMVERKPTEGRRTRLALTISAFERMAAYLGENK